MSWTPERDAELARLAGLGWSAERIAHHLKVTALAVHGRCTRKSIALGAEANGLAKPLSVKQAARRDEIVAANAADPLFGIAPPPRADAWRPLPDAPAPLPLVECSPAQCTWPIGDSDAVSDWLCCAADKPASLPYCAQHTALAYQGGRYHRPRVDTSIFFRSSLRYAA